MITGKTRMPYSRCTRLVSMRGKINQKHAVHVRCQYILPTVSIVLRLAFANMATAIDRLLKRCNEARFAHGTVIAAAMISKLSCEFVVPICSLRSLRDRTAV